MTSKHTPGPWVAKPTAGHETHGQSAVYDEATGKDIAIVYDGDSHASLIAAAPDMLAALLDIRDHAKHGRPLSPDALARIAGAAIP